MDKIDISPLSPENSVNQLDTHLYEGMYDILDSLQAFNLLMKSLKNSNLSKEGKYSLVMSICFRAGKYFETVKLGQSHDNHALLRQLLNGTRDLIEGK